MFGMPQLTGAAQVCSCGLRFADGLSAILGHPRQRRRPGRFPGEQALCACLAAVAILTISRNWARRSALRNFRKRFAVQDDVPLAKGAGRLLPWLEDHADQHVVWPANL